MSYMFEVYYLGPEDPEREGRLVADAVVAGGRLDFREACGGKTICLTFEFEERATAEAVERMFRQRGEHTEGVSDYG